MRLPEAYSNRSRGADSVKEEISPMDNCGENYSDQTLAVSSRQFEGMYDILPGNICKPVHFLWSEVLVPEVNYGFG